MNDLMLIQKRLNCYSATLYVILCTGTGSYPVTETTHCLHASACDGQKAPR